MPAITNPVLRLAICIAAVLCISALYGFGVHVRPAVVALTLLLPILFVSVAWGLRYALFQCVISTLAYSLFLPPLGSFRIADPSDWVASFAFLVTGITASQLSERVRRAARHAEEARGGADAAQQREP